MAYGARLESVLGASPRGFESPILRHRTPGPLQVPGFLLPAAPPDLRPPRVLPAREPSAPRASLGVVDLEARPCPPVPPAPSTPAALVSLGQARPGPAAAHRHRGQTLRALRRPPHRRRMWCSVHRPLIGRSRAAEPRPRPLIRLRGPRRSLRPGVRQGPRPSQRASIGAGPSRCSSIRPSMPSR